MKPDFIPKYKKLYSELSLRLKNGVYPPGSRLPSEKELCREFQISRITARHALDLLTKSGDIIKKNGSGTYAGKKPVFSENDIFPLEPVSAKYRISFGLSNPSPVEELLYKTFAGLFHTENPEMAVDIQNIFRRVSPYNDVWLELISHNELPACGYFYYYGMYAHCNELLPLEKMEGFDELYQQLNPQSIREIKNPAGSKSIYAIASTMTTSAFMANTDILAAAGIDANEELSDWETLYKWVAAIHSSCRKNGRNRISPFSLGIPSGIQKIVGLLPFFWQDIPDDEFDSSSLECFKSIFETKGCQRGLRFLKSLTAFTPPEERDVSYSRFNIGDVGILLQSITHPLVMKESMYEETPIKAFPIPPEKKNGIFRNYYGDGSYGIFRNGVRNEKEKEVAWKWLQFLFRKQHQYMLSSNMTYPTMEGCDSFIEKKYPQCGKVMRQTLANARKQFDFPNVRKCFAIVSDELRPFFLSDDITVQKSLRSIRKNLNEVKLN